MKILLVSLMMAVMVTGVAQAEELKKLNLDDASSINPRIASDSEDKVEGESSIKITTEWPTIVFLGQVAGLDVEDSMLIYSAKIKTDLEEGSAYLELWAHVGEGKYFSKGLDDVVTGKTDWKTIRTPFMFQKGQVPEKVTLNLVIDGKGTVWVDDIVLSKEPLK